MTINIFRGQMNLGIDIGRVIIAPDSANDEDTSFFGGTTKHVLATPASDGVYEVLPDLVRQFDGRIWLISKARKGVQEKTRLWFAHQRFFERTGIPADHLRFCLDRADKAGHCHELGITHFIDDREDVLEHMAGIVEHRYLFGPQRKKIPAGLVHVESWSSVLRALTGDSP